MQIRNVVVPLDGSALAEHALPLACLVARRANACLRLVTVVPGAGFLDPEALPAFVGEGVRDAVSELTRYVEGVADRVHRDAYVRATHRVRIDAPVAGILKAVSDERGDLIVMTSHGRGGFRRAWLGSVTDAVLRHSSVPVLVAKAREVGVPDLRREPSLDSVVVPLDGSPMGEAALEPATALAEALDLKLRLLRVIVPAMPLVPPYTHAVIELPDDDARAEAYLADVVERIRSGGVEASATTIRDDAVAPCIVSFAAGAIAVIATNERAGVGRFILGSIPDKVLRMSDYPVMMVRAAPVATEDEADGWLESAAAR